MDKLKLNTAWDKRMLQVGIAWICMRNGHIVIQCIKHTAALSTALCKLHSRTAAPDTSVQCRLVLELASGQSCQNPLPVHM